MQLMSVRFRPSRVRDRLVEAVGGVLRAPDLVDQLLEDCRVIS